jgi:hypothetical protein
MNHPSANWLSVLALVIMGGLSAALIFHTVPQDNQQLVTFALGAISGALTVGGAGKLADKITTSQSDTATINPESK